MAVALTSFRLCLTLLLQYNGFGPDSVIRRPNEMQRRSEAGIRNSGRRIDPILFEFERKTKDLIVRQDMTLSVS